MDTLENSPSPRTCCAAPPLAAALDSAQRTSTNTMPPPTQPGPATIPPPGASGRHRSSTLSSHSAHSVNSAISAHSVHSAHSANSANAAKADKLAQIIQNLYVKTCHVVIESRTVTPTFSSSDRPPLATVVPPPAPRGNKWFNLQLEDPGSYKEDLRPWKSFDGSLAQLKPLVLETFLDIRGLTPRQTLSLVPEGGKPVPITTGAGRKKSEVVLERWLIDFVPDESQLGSGAVHTSQYNQQDLPGVYKRAIVLFRSLYTYCRLLPSYALLRKLCKVKLSVSPLKIGCRILDGTQPITSRGRIGLSRSFINPTSTKNSTNYPAAHLGVHKFPSLETPAGEFRISLSYRLDTQFHVDDSETLLSSHFLSLDESRRRPAADALRRFSLHSMSFTPPSGFPGSPAGAASSPGSSARPSVAFLQPFKANPLAEPATEQTTDSVDTETGPASLGSSRNSARHVASPPVAVRRIPSVASSSPTSPSSVFSRMSSFSARRRKFPSTSSSVWSSPGPGLYMDDDEIGEFVKMVDSRPSLHYSADNRDFARFNSMRNSHIQLSDSMANSICIRRSSHAPLVRSHLSEVVSGGPGMAGKPGVAGVEATDGSGDVHSLSGGLLGSSGAAETSGDREKGFPSRFVDDDDDLVFAMSDMNVCDARSGI